MEQPRLMKMKPKVNTDLTEVLPEDLVEGPLYLIEQGYTSFDVHRYKGIFLENVIRDDTSDTPVIESCFRIQKYPQFMGKQPIGKIEGF